MKPKRLLATSFLIVMLSPARAWAGHVVWIDFSAFVHGERQPSTEGLGP